MTEKQWYKLIEAWYVACAEADKADKKKKEAAKALMQAMDDANIKQKSNGIYTVTRVSDSMATYYDYEKMDAENPGLREKYSYKKPKKGFLKK